MSAITAMLVVEADGTLPLPVSADLWPGKVQIVATLAAVPDASGTMACAGVRMENGKWKMENCGAWRDAMSFDYG